MHIKFRNLFQRDIDQVFSYRTNIEVVILDRYIGILYRLLQLAFLIFFFYCNFAGISPLFKQYYSKGSTLIQIAGSGTTQEGSTSKEFYDDVDIKTPDIFSNSVFLKTKLTVIPETRDICGTSEYECQNDDDCKVYFKEKCQNNTCVGYDWCPNEGNQNNAMIYNISDNVLIWIRSFIEFDHFDDSKTFSTYHSNEPIFSDSEDVNVFSLNSLLKFAPDNLKFSDLKENGGILHVKIFWKCYFFDSCHPEISVQRIDSSGGSSLTGYKTTKYSYSSDNSGNAERTVYDMTGIKLIFETEGAGYKMTAENIILQIANLFALMLVPRLIADFILIYLLRYEDYAGYKYENTLNNKANDGDDEKESEKELKPEPKKKPNVDDEAEEEEEKKDESEDISLLKDIDSN